MAITLNKKIGNDFLVYVDTADDFSTPTWSLLDDAGESLGIDHGPTAVAINRRNKDIRYRQGRNDRTLSFQVVVDEDNSDFTKLQAAAYADTGLHLAIADGAIATSGTKYWHAEFSISGWSESYDLDDGAVVDVEMKIAQTANDPTYVTVA